MLQANLNAIINVGFHKTAYNGTYSVYGAGGTSAQQPKLIIIYTTPCTNPSIAGAGQPTNQTVCPNGTANLSVTATGTNLTYQWRKGTTPLTNGGNISGVATATLTISNVSAGDVVSDYNVVVSGDCGSPVTSNNASVSLADPAPAQPSGFTTFVANVCTNQTGVAYEVGTVSGATSYNWTYSGNGANINGTGNSVTIDFANNATDGTLSVAAVNSCGSSTALTGNITVHSIPNASTGITGNTDICGTGGQSYVAAVVANATSYTWSVSGGGSVSGGQGTANATINWTSGGTHTVSVTADNDCGSSQPTTLQVKITETVPAQPDNFSVSTASVCQGQSGVTYSVDAVAGATSYTWSYSGNGATINGSGNTVTVDFSSSATGGDLSVAAVNTCGTGIDRVLTISVNIAPATPASFTTGAATVCQGENGVIYEVPAVSGATAYLWDFTGIGATVNSNSNSVTVDFAPSATSGNLRVFSQNACGNSATPQTIAITVDPLPLQPDAFTQGEAVVCQGESNIAYTVPVVIGATGYSWSFSGAGVTINDNNNTATLDFAASATSGILSVSAENDCGTGQARTFSITVNEPAAQPATFVVAPATACQGETGVAYEVDAVNGATSYSWTYSGNGETINGTGNAVTIDFDNTATSGDLSVIAENSCGSSLPLSTSISINNLPDPTGGFIVAAQVVCQGETSVAYEVDAVNGATSYSWTYSGNGETINGTGNAVTVDFDNAATSGDLTVAAENVCGLSTAESVTITVNELPAQPINFSVSSASVCQGETGVAYEVDAVNGATSYNWTYSGNGETINGTGNAVTVDFDNAATSGDLSVVAENGCGSSQPLTTNITINVLPETPANFSGENALCENESAIYSVDAQQGVTYNWTLPSGWNGSSNTETITVTTGNTGGDIEVSVENSCGSSQPVSFTVAVNALPQVTLVAFNNACHTDGSFTLTGGSPAGGDYFVDGNPATVFDPSAAGVGNYTITYQYTDGNGCANEVSEDLLVDICSGIDNYIANDIVLYPNPATQYTTLLLPVGIADNCVITIYDAQGKVVVNTSEYITPSTMRINTAKYATGIYRVQVTTGLMNINKALIITE